jgi:hypothetical protein
MSTPPFSIVDYKAVVALAADFIRPPGSSKYGRGRSERFHLSRHILATDHGGYFNRVSSNPVF